MLVKILLVLAAIVVVFIVIVAFQPSEFRIARSATIAAPASLIFAQVNDLHKWQDWSPWAKIDPNAKLTYSGPSSGSGAAYSWAGNKEVGEGTMTITESQPGDLVRFKLDFLKPFQASNTAEFTFKPDGDQTRVTWSMSGRNNFMFKAVGLFMNCDKMVGSEFEKGLATLKSVSETAAQNH